MRLWLLPVLVLCALMLSASHPGARQPIETTSILLQQMDDPAVWRVAGPPGTAYFKGTSLLSSRDKPNDAQAGSLRLQADFTTATPEYIRLLGAVRAPGRVCRSLSLWIRGDGSGSLMSIVLEDARGRWFVRDIARLEGDAWEQRSVSVGDGAGWQPLLREGEQPLPLTHPVTIRELRLSRPTTPTNRTVTVLLGELAGEFDADGLGSLVASLRAERPAGLFIEKDRVLLRIAIRNLGRTPFRGRGLLEIEPLTGPRTTRDLGPIELPPQAGSTIEVRPDTQWFGPHEARLVIVSENEHRIWTGRFARIRSSAMRLGGQSYRFGGCGNVEGPPETSSAAMRRLNRLGGLGWTRLGLSWEQVNPVPGVFVWDPPIRIPGPVGSALRTAGRTYRADVASLRGISDEVTVAFWARLSSRANRTLWPVLAARSGTVHPFGACFRRDTGSFAFSASYERRPGVMMEFVSGPTAHDGQWHHYAATYSRHIKQVCLYVDGRLITSALHDGGKLQPAPSAIRVGAGGPMDLDQILIYSRALGPADVAAIARRQTPPRDNQVVEWAFDSPTGLLVSADRNATLRVEEPDAIRWAKEAREQGMRVLAILGFPPPWATSVPPSTGDPDGRPGLPDMTAWGTYVERVTRHYRGLIDHWEIWHEPNTEDFWPGAPDPGRYASLLRIAYAAAKRGNPRCDVVMPGLAGPDERDRGYDYLERLFAFGAAHSCDAVSVHPYRRGDPEFTGMARQLSRIANLAGTHGRRKPIWITENTWTTELVTGVSERTQAAFLARSYVLALSQGTVEKLFWYRLFDSGSDRFAPADNCGLCRDDLTPKPAFFAHRTMAVLLNGAVPLATVAPGPGTRACLFRSGSERLAAVWSPRGRSTVAIRIERPKAQITDLMGNSFFSKADEGILLVDAGDLISFVRYLRPGDRWMGEPVVLRPATVISGANAALSLHLKNPFTSTRQVMLKLEPWAPAVPGVSGRLHRDAVTLRSGEESVVRLNLTVPAGVRDMSAVLTVRATFRRDSGIGAVTTGQAEDPVVSVATPITFR